METLFGLLCVHALCDFALQSDVMAKGKNRNRRTEPPPGAQYQPTWGYWLSAHALIHGLGVYVVTGSPWLGLAETAVHWLTDFGKCDNRYGIHTDQGIHIGSKVLWAVLV
jgi:hypothetical protein